MELNKENKRSEDSLRDLLNNSKYTNYTIIGVPEKKIERKGPKKYLKR